MKVGDLVCSRYLVESFVGRGGMQNVYKARDVLLDVDVAVKSPQLGKVDKRFKSSARIAAKVNHHNVAKTLDYVEQGGVQYLIEEFVVGETLEDKLQRFGVMDPHLAAGIFHHLAKGISASHHAGVVHRDLKPSNIMTQAGVDVSLLKITDFGIATLTQEVFDEEAQHGDLTRSTSGTIKGALPYMAPEMMFRQPGEHPGKEADIWSLGAMVFRLLTGDFPFGVFLDAAVNVKNKNIKSWPNFMTEKEQYQPIAVEMQRLVESCLEYDPSNRPTADELASKVADLCYINIPRKEGYVYRIIQNGYSGFASGAGGDVFFSMQSVYGPNKPTESKNNKICYSEFPGSPRFRAHPVVVIK